MSTTFPLKSLAPNVEYLQRYDGKSWYCNSIVDTVKYEYALFASLSLL